MNSKRCRYKILPDYFQRLLNQAFPKAKADSRYHDFISQQSDKWRASILMGPLSPKQLCDFLGESVFNLLGIFPETANISGSYESRHESENTNFRLGKTSGFLGNVSLGTATGIPVHCLHCKLELPIEVTHRLRQHPVLLVCIKTVLDIIVPITSDYSLCFLTAKKARFVLGDEDKFQFNRLGLSTRLGKSV